jgi:hypothetical protein
MPQLVFESSGSNEVKVPLALVGDGRLKPVPLDPEDDFRLRKLESAF